MAKAEIVISLQNAVAQGEGLQKAMQSLVNAGYSVQDVQEASQNLNMGATGLMSQSPVASIITPTDVSQEQVQALAPAEPKKTNMKKLIILSAVFIVLLGVAGYVLYTMFK